MSRRSRGPAGTAVVVAALGALLLARGCGDRPPPPPAPPAPASPYAADGCPAGAPTSTPTARNVLLVCLDTVRADAFDPPAGSETLMPRLAAWAKTAVTFTNATAAAPWTGPSVTSLLTGLPPSEHGARDFDSFRLVDAVPTLAEILRCRQWRTIAYAGGAFLLDRFVAMSSSATWLLFLHTYEAHDPYEGPPDSPGATVPAPPPGLTRTVVAAEPDGAVALRFLTDASSRPLFEGPPGAPILERVKRYFERGWSRDPAGADVAAKARAAYERGVRRLDAGLGDFLEGAERGGLLKDTIVIVTSDHGEGFGEHGSLHHGRRLYDELLRVPLLVRAPGWPAGKRFDAPVSTLDVVPTVCGLLGLPPPARGDGESLEAVVRGGAGHPCIAEEQRTPAETGFPGTQAVASVRDARWKCILTKERGAAGTMKTEIYDLGADPGETNPLPGGPSVTWSMPFEEARGRRVRALGGN